MQEINLTTVFKGSVSQLEEDLSKFFLPKDYAEVQKTINKHIIALFSGDNEFKNSLNASDAELLNAALRMALSFQKLSLSESIDFKQLSIKKEVDVENNTKNDNIVENTITLLPTVICAFINPWLALAVGGSTVFVKKYIKTSQGKRKAVYVKERNVDISHHISENEINVIKNGIYNICQDIDSIISKIQRDRKDLEAQANQKLSECNLHKMYPQILNSIQYLYMENLKAEKTSQFLQNILFSLESYGYKFVEYSEKVGGYFNKKGNPNVSEPTMYLPSIIMENNEGMPIVVCEGIVYMPQK